MSRDWKPFEMYLADKQLFPRTGKHLYEHEIVYKLTDNNGIEKTYQDTKGKRIRELAKKYEYLPIVCPDLMIDLVDDDRVSEDEIELFNAEIMSIMECVGRGRDIAKAIARDFVKKWFVGELDSNFYYREKNDRELQERLENMSKGKWVLSNEEIYCEIIKMVDDKLDNMVDSEISDKVYRECTMNTLSIGKIAYDLFINGFKDEDEECKFDIEWLTRDCEYSTTWTDEEIEKERFKDALYNYDALWMVAIKKFFGHKVTNTKCGDGQICFIEEATQYEKMKKIETKISKFERQYRKAQELRSEIMDDLEELMSELGSEEDVMYYEGFEDECDWCYGIDDSKWHMVIKQLLINGRKED